MKRKVLIVVGLVVVLIALMVAVISASGIAAGKADLAKVRKATAQFHRIEVARAAGHDLLPDLDHCFSNPGVGAMGYHYINAESLDLTVDPLKPEALVYAYAPGQKGQLKLGAVEYIVPTAEWDAAGNTELPSVMGQSFHLNSDLGVYVLHAWIWQNNPTGIFEDWNPTVSCP